MIWTTIRHVAVGDTVWFEAKLRSVRDAVLANHGKVVDVDPSDPVLVEDGVPMSPQKDSDRTTCRICGDAFRHPIMPDLCWSCARKATFVDDPARSQSWQCHLCKTVHAPWVVACRCAVSNETYTAKVEIGG